MSTKKDDRTVIRIAPSDVEAMRDPAWLTVDTQDGSFEFSTREATVWANHHGLEALEVISDGLTHVTVRHSDVNVSIRRGDDKDGSQTLDITIIDADGNERTLTVPCAGRG